jgi:hypothetical protein
VFQLYLVETSERLKMKFSIFIDVTILLLMLFILKKKKLPLLENILILLILELVVTSYCAILYINLNLWDLAKSIAPYVVFRIYEAIFNPLIYLFYFNLLLSISTRSSKGLLTLLFIAVQTVGEQWLVQLGVITYKDWQVWQSILVQFFVLSATTLLLAGYRKILQKEGIR